MIGGVLGEFPSPLAQTLPGSGAPRADNRNRWQCGEIPHPVRIVGASPVPGEVHVQPTHSCFGRAVPGLPYQLLLRDRMAMSALSVQCSLRLIPKSQAAGLRVSARLLKAG